jgi:hypothetical protein
MVGRTAFSFFRDETPTSYRPSRAFFERWRSYTVGLLRLHTIVSLTANGP